MKRATEDMEKSMGPLFPRLNAHDAPEKGGPRAPPRNKMALYEQLSVPSRRFRPGIASTKPISLHNNGTEFPCASSNQGSGKERSHLTSFYVQNPSSYSTDKVHSRLSNGGNAKASSGTFQPKSIKTDGHKASSSASDYNSPQNKASKRKDLSRRRLGDEDDFMVPTFVESETNTNKDKAALFGLMDSGTGTTTTTDDSTQVHMVASCNCASQLWKSQKLSLKGPNTTNKNYRHSGQISVVRAKHLAQETQNGMVPVVDSTENITSLPNFGALPSEKTGYRGKSGQSRDWGGGSLSDDGNTSNKYVPLGETNSVLSFDNRCIEASVQNIVVNISDEDDRSMISNECMSAESPANCSATPTNKHANQELQPDDGDKNDDLQETMPMTVSASEHEISPDDIVGTIGPKQFWKARRAIMNQQRIFSLQVFELHRLIKVQKYLAGSPHLLLADELYSMSHSKKRADTHVFPDEDSRSEPPMMNQKPELPKFSQSSELSAGRSAGKTVSIVDNNIQKGLLNQASSHGHPNINPSHGSAVVDGKTMPCWFPSVGTQWLVPVMSPSEGLVYKPFTGPSPPVGSFMAPAYATYPPMHFPVGGDLSNMAYGVPPSYQQNGMGIISGSPNYFPPYVHVSNPMLSGRVTSDQADAPVCDLSHHVQAEKFPAENTFNAISRGSCNMPDPKSKALCPLRTIQASKETEFQGSTASTSCSFGRAQESEDQPSEERTNLPLSPGILAVQKTVCTDLQSSEQQARLIKVVPHNAEFATESAARIFWSIQKERELHD